MAFQEHTESKPERPFEGLKIYFSGPIVVAKDGDSDFNWELVQFMKEKGAKVLSEHVGGRNQDERNILFRKNTGVEDESNDSVVRTADIRWVDECHVMVSVINRASFGIGMEMQRAIDKPKMGKNFTPILCLLSNEITARQSKMITGITDDENPGFTVARYGTTEEAKQAIFNFLSKH